MSEQRAIVEMVSEAKPGAVFVPSDFAEAGSADAVRKALSRMVEAGELERPMRGLYRKPRRSAFLDKAVPASPDEIAEALARKFEWRIALRGHGPQSTGRGLPSSFGRALRERRAVPDLSVRPLYDRVQAYSQSRPVEAEPRCGHRRPGVEGTRQRRRNGRRARHHLLPARRFADGEARVGDPQLNVMGKRSG